MIADPAHLRRQRNLFAGAAITIIAVTLAIALPRRVREYHYHRGMNEELIRLQSAINTVQTQIREAQQQILEGQEKLSRDP